MSVAKSVWCMRGATSIAVSIVVAQCSCNHFLLVYRLKFGIHEIR